MARKTTATATTKKTVKSTPAKPVNVLVDTTAKQPVGETNAEKAMDVVKKAEKGVVEKAEEVVGKVVGEMKEATEAGKVEKAAEKPAPKKPRAVKKEETPLEKKVFVQYAGKEIDLDAIEEEVRKIWEAEGHRVSSVKKIEIYVKPEENKAYYVINSKNAGSIDL